MNVAVIDVGSNSVRLLVAAVDESGRVEQLARERAYLRLGDDAYRLGRVSAEKLAQTAIVARRYVSVASEQGSERLTTIVTAPGRQAANGDVLVRVLAEATDAPVTLLDADEEGRLAWEGAVARMKVPQQRVAVVDLGGGSCEVAVGAPGIGPDWVRSRDAGALRVTRALLANGASGRVREARKAVEELVGDLDPPRSDAALAVGGTARAIGRLLGRRFGARALERLAKRLAKEGAPAVTAGTAITEERGETLLGGTLVLASIARQLDSQLEVGRGGLREGAAVSLVRGARVAA